MVGVLLGLRFARRARDDAIDAVAVIWLLGLQREAELFAHDPCEEPADRMLLPAGGLHDDRNRRSLGPAQQVENFGLFGIRTRLGLNGLPAIGGLICGGPSLYPSGGLGFCPFPSPAV